MFSTIPDLYPLDGEAPPSSRKTPECFQTLIHVPGKQRHLQFQCTEIKGSTGEFWGALELFCILIEVVITSVYTFVTTHTSVFKMSV